MATSNLRKGSDENILISELSRSLSEQYISEAIYMYKQYGRVLSIYADNFGGTTVSLQWSFYPDKNFQNIKDTAGDDVSYTNNMQGVALSLSGFYVRTVITAASYPATITNLSIKVA